MMNKNTFIKKKRILLIKVVLFFTAVLLILNGCAGSSENGKKTEDLSPVSKPLPPDPQKKLAPGTARIEAILLGTNEQDNNTSCVLRVEKVLGYGMATRPVGVGTELTVDMTGFKSKTFSEDKKDQKYILIIQQQENLSLSSAKSTWRALKIQKKESEE